ncbi:hypothetical protein DT075_21795 [Bacillus licheniformis]|nr:hypothetical protein DT075_21795 [Bacillus licheniformis]
MRYYFNQFGLGVKTGIDLPQESAGMQTNPKIVGGLLLDEAIGQFDTYTPLQPVLAGYQDGMPHGQSYLDQELSFAGGVKKGSYRGNTIGWANEVRALEKSSNVYMFYVAMRMAGITY